MTKHAHLTALAKEVGSDGKLVQGPDGVYHVTLLEKLLVSVLAKVSNFVPGAGHLAQHAAARVE